MADPERPAGLVVCHNDVCLENVVFRGRMAVALLDFDFAAPGRRSHDLACFARMCVPVDDDVSRANLGWEVTRLPHRLRLIVDTYGCSQGDRREIMASLDRGVADGGEFVRRHAEAGEPGFVEMWASIGGMARFDRRREWWRRHRADFAVDDGVTRTVGPRHICRTGSDCAMLSLSDCERGRTSLRAGA